MRLDKAIRIAALVLLASGLAACADNPLGPQVDSERQNNCVWVDGVLQCELG
ncbi:MAG: hypothetical protein P8177_10720 [Gemmatimonadota bacterium]|jgi:hypothetical protein